MNSRAFSATLVGSLLIPLVSVMYLYSQSRDFLVVARFSDHPITLLIKPFLIFMPLLEFPNGYRAVAQPGLTACRIACVVLFPTLLYLANRATTYSMGPLRAGIVAAGSAMLAGGLSDVIGEAVTVYRLLSLSEGDLSTAFAISHWQGDGRYLGFFIGLFAFLTYSLAFVNARWAARVNGALPSSTADVCVRDVGKHGRRIAVFSTMPLLVLLLLGGVNQFTSILVEYIPPESYSWFGALGRHIFFENHLRLAPPVIPRDPGDLLNLPFPKLNLVDVWFVPALNSLIMIFTLWLMLSFVLSRVSLISTISAPAVFALGWSITVLAGSAAGIARAATSTLFSPFGPLLDPSIFYSPSDPSLSNFFEEIPWNIIRAMQFPSIWGWLVGIALLISYRNSVSLARQGLSK